MEMSTDFSKKCPHCGKEIWPQLATAVIVLITRNNNEEVLLVHARNFLRDFFGLVAGFVETGETLEEAVQREVMEETGITISNIRYFASQPWPYPSGLMVGFKADYVEGEIHLQESELSKGGWFRYDQLPEIPEKLSIARRLIDSWLKEKNLVSFPPRLSYSLIYAYLHEHAVSMPQNALKQPCSKSLITNGKVRFPFEMVIKTIIGHQIAFLYLQGSIYVRHGLPCVIPLTLFYKHHRNFKSLKKVPIISTFTCCNIYPVRFFVFFSCIF